MRQAFAFALLILVACKTQATKTEKARDELASWAAAGEMLSSGWARGDAQTPYVKSTAKVASNEIDQLRQQLQSDRESARALDEVATLYGRLSTAVAQEDRASAAQLARPFHEVSERVKPPS